jgi:hypothetical protein
VRSLHYLTGRTPPPFPAEPEQSKLFAPKDSRRIIVEITTIIFFYYRGKKTHINTKIGPNESDLDDYLCTAMAKQVNLTKKQFGALVECTLTDEVYGQMLIAAGHVRIEPSRQPKP